MHRIAKGLATALVAALMPVAASASSSLLGFYPLDGNFNDASGNGNNGTAGSVAPTFGPGHTGAAGDQGAVFTGADATQLFTIPIDLNSLDQVTFGAWVKSTNNNPIRGIISNDTGSFGRTIDIDDRAGSTGFSAFAGGTGVIGGIAPSAGFDFVAVVYNHTAGTEALYVNNQKVTATGTPPVGETHITVGRNPNFDNPFGGTIDDVFVFGTALNDTQIANIRANGVTPVGPPPPGVPLPAAFGPSILLLGSLAAVAGLRRRGNRIA